jgi:hypothetical protein
MGEKDADTLRITNQFHSKGSMVYDLREGGARLTVVVTQRASADDRDEWRVQARTGGQPDAPHVEEWGPTKIDALRAVGKTWESPASGLPRFDWEAVVRALLAVRAV